MRKVQAEQEAVNKALVEVQDARDAATTAQQQVDASEQAVKDANAAITAAQKRFDTFAAATYVNGPSGRTGDGHQSRRDHLQRIGRADAGRQLRAGDDRSAAGPHRAGQQGVGGPTGQAESRPGRRRRSRRARTRRSSALTDAQKTFRDQQAEIDRLAAERKTAQEKLDAARQWSAPTGAPAAVPQAAAPGTGDVGRPLGSGRAGLQCRTGRRQGALRQGLEWDLTLPAVPSAFVSGDPIQIINAVLQIASTSLQTTQNLGKSFLQKLGILKPTDTGITNGQIPFVYGSTAVGVRHQARHVADGCALLLGWRHRRRPQQRHRQRRGHRRIRLLGADSVCLRGRRYQAAALLGIAVQHGHARFRRRRCVAAT